MIRPHDILRFWFDNLEESQWWTASDTLDAEVTARFGRALEAAAEGELFRWRRRMEGRLAEIIILDQFSRMVYRDTPRAFAQDAMALALAQEAVRTGGYERWPADWKGFLFTPYMHSESRAIHKEAMRLYASDPALAYNLEFEVKHKAIIDRFGRYPHRNDILGRESTDEERAFLKEPGSRF